MKFSLEIFFFFLNWKLNISIGNLKYRERNGVFYYKRFVFYSK